MLPNNSPLRGIAGHGDDRASFAVESSIWAGDIRTPFALAASSSASSVNGLPVYMTPTSVNRHTNP